MTAGGWGYCSSVPSTATTLLAALAKCAAPIGQHQRVPAVQPPPPAAPQPGGVALHVGPPAALRRAEAVAMPHLHLLLPHVVECMRRLVSQGRLSYAAPPHPQAGRLHTAAPPAAAVRGSQPPGWRPLCNTGWFNYSVNKSPAKSQPFPPAPPTSPAPAGWHPAPAQCTPGSARAPGTAQPGSCAPPAAAR